MQIYGVLSEILEKHPTLTHGLIMGGANRQTEAQKLFKGVSFLVATPGRLLDHLQVIQLFNNHYKKILMFLYPWMFIVIIFFIWHKNIVISAEYR